MLDFNKCLRLKSKLKNKLFNNSLEEFENLIKEYEKYNPNDFELYTIKSNYYFMNKDYNSAEKELLKGYHLFEFNFDINYNLAIIYLHKEDFIKASYYFSRCILCNTESVEFISKEIENLINNNYISMKAFDSIEKKINNIKINTNKLFPRDTMNSTYIGKFLYKDANKGYMPGYYDYYYAERDNLLKDISANEIRFFKTETLLSERVKNISFSVDKKTVIPIMILKDTSQVNIYINDIQYPLYNLLPKRFYYFPVEENNNIRIECKDYFILGDLITLDNDKNKPRLILNIFIDGLSQKFIEDNNIKDLIPNIYNFFKEGTICENSYVSGEWTYVSLASFFTGLYTNEHMVFHPMYNTDNLWKKELFSEILHTEGYFATKIDGDWRSTPSSGYIKGFNRYIYQPSVRGMHSDEVILETIEHLEAFKEKNNFVWICLPDLHDIADEFETKVSSQISNNIGSRIFNKTSETSVRKNYDIKKIHRYKNQLKRIDTYVGLLLNYIKEHYSDDEILVSLMSDHGQGFLVKSEELLDEERSKVPMMFRGVNIPKGICNELIQGLDLFPILLNSAGIKNFDKKQGNIPKYFGGNNERDYTFTESIFPGSTYKAVINNLTHKFFFETKDKCGTDGRFKAYEYTFKLINKNNSKDETSKFKDKADNYLEIVFNHISKHIILE